RPSSGPALIAAGNVTENVVAVAGPIVATRNAAIARKSFTDYSPSPSRASIAQRARRGKRRLPVRQLDGIAVGVLAVAEMEHLADPRLAEAGTARDQPLALGGDVLGMEHELGSLAAGRGGTGMQRDGHPSGIELAPALLGGDLLQAQHLAVEFAHRIHPRGEQDHPRQLHLRHHTASSARSRSSQMSFTSSSPTERRSSPLVTPNSARAS